jgi:cell division protein FtsI/penicillin-binding protein 2
MRSRRLPIVLFALALLAGAAAIWIVRAALEPDPAEPVEAFLADWEAGRDRQAAAQSDARRAAAAALKANRLGLDGARLEARTVELSQRDDSAQARVRLSWAVPGIGPFAYETRIPVRKDGDGWRVHWTPTLVHPRLERDTRLGTTRAAFERAPILDRDGVPIVRERPVVRVGAVVKDVSDPPATATGLARVLGVERRPILRQLRGGGPEQFVEAIVLRRDDYAAVQAQVEAIPDASAFDDTAPLSPSREFARGVLGTFAPITAEQLERLRGGYAPGDQVGQAGLQARFERRLAGIPTRRVLVRRARGAGEPSISGRTIDGGRPLQTLFERKGRAGRALQTTLSTRVQDAAEDALGDRRDAAALVALEASSGDVLAVAERPVDSGFHRALEGRYPPGSTFKVVTTAALLRAGLDVGETVNCPPTVSVGGRAFRNFEGGEAGAVAFSQDFAQSCNTAFVSLAGRLAPEALARTARDFGFGRRLDLPLGAARAQVPAGEDAVEQAAAMIGQHEILASPLTMAGVAGTVAAGRWHAPRLVASDPRVAGRPLPEGEPDTLAALMRSVITSGTGQALAGVAGEPAGKSGTAEFGGGDPPRTHAWFIAFRGDVAVAVLVEFGRSGGEVAAPLAGAFFEAFGTSL